MRAETSQGNSIVPASVSSVNEVVSSALAGVPVRLFPLGLAVSADATTDEVYSAIERLTGVSDAATLVLRFCIGDTYRHTRKRSPERKALVERIVERYGERYEAYVRKWAWVCGVWSIDRRSASKTWGWYEVNKPGVPAAPKRKKMPLMIRLVSEESVPAGTLLTYVDAYGGEYNAVVAKVVDDH